MDLLSNVKNKQYKYKTLIVHIGYNPECPLLYSAMSAVKRARMEDLNIVMVSGPTNGTLHIPACSEIRIAKINIAKWLQKWHRSPLEQAAKTSWL